MALKSILLHDYGAYAFTLELARALARRGHRVAYAYSGDLRAPSGPTILPPSPCTGSPPVRRLPNTPISAAAGKSGAMPRVS